MEFLTKIWKRITRTKALELASGEYELMVFENIYRVTYAIGVSTVDRGTPYLIYSSLVKLMIALIIIGGIGYACSGDHSMDEVVSSINILVIQFLSLFKAKSMVDHKELYERISTSMESPYFDTTTVERKRLVDFWARTHEKYFKLLLGLGNCSLLAWQFYPLIDEIDYNLMVGIRLPFRYDYPVIYPITYVIVGMSLQYTAHFVMVTDLRMQAHLVPLLCQMSVLADCFKNIIRDCSKGFAETDTNQLILNEQFKGVFLKKLYNYVQHHKMILNYTMELRSILSVPMLGQMAASGILICFVGFQTTVAISKLDNIIMCLMSTFYLGYNMFVLYVLCSWCDEIKVQSQNIGDAAYSSCWESGTSTLPGVKSAMLLTIGRANKPLVFTAGGMYDISLQSYTTLVKASYSALTFVMRKRRE